jgi:hypothetical protein
MQHKLVRLALVAGALSVAAPAAALPEVGVLRPGESLASVRLGMTKAQVLRQWGARHGVCRECERTTWYFTYRRFAPEGAGVAFRRGRVVHVFTVWKPAGWRTDDGLVLGADANDVTRAYPALERIACGRYHALVLPARRAVTAFYILDEQLWGFGLMRSRGAACL